MTVKDGMCLKCFSEFLTMKMRCNSALVQQEIGCNLICFSSERIGNGCDSEAGHRLGFETDSAKVAAANLLEANAETEKILSIFTRNLKDCYTKNIFPTESR